MFLLWVWVCIFFVSLTACSFIRWQFWFRSWNYWLWREKRDFYDTILQFYDIQLRKRRAQKRFHLYEYTAFWKRSLNYMIRLMQHNEKPKCVAVADHALQILWQMCALDKGAVRVFTKVWFCIKSAKTYQKNERENNEFLVISYLESM